MVKRLGMIALALVMWTLPAAAAKGRLLCNDGAVKKANSEGCKRHSGVSMILPKYGPPTAPVSVTVTAPTP